MAKTNTKTTTKSKATAASTNGKVDKRAEKHAAAYKAFGVEVGACLDGCGGSPRKGLFLPGHDARLKSALQKAAREGNAAQRGKAEKQATVLGWEHLLPAPVPAT